MHLLHTPAAADELRREPIEQFRVRGFHAHAAKITRCLDEAGAEVALPEAIHHHAGGERILRAGDPLREREASLLLGRFLRELQIAQGAEHRGHDGFLRLLGIAAIEHMDVVWRAEGAGEDFLRGIQALEFLIERPFLIEQALGFGDFFFSEALGGKRRLRAIPRVKTLAVIGVRHRFPCA